MIKMEEKPVLTIPVDSKEFFKNWNPEELKRLSQEERESIIKWFLNRQLALKRDNFKCQNASCNHNLTKLPIPERRDLMTVHHKIPRRDFKENRTLVKHLNYECDDLQNLTTLCKYCHIDYERAKLEILIDGQSYKLEKPSSVDFKAIIKEGKRMRRQLKKLGEVGWGKITEEERMELIYLMMRWLTRHWTEIAETY